MQPLAPLGAAAVDEQQLTERVADQLGVATVDLRVTDVAIEPVAYDVPSITTVARHHVRGSADVAGEAQEFAFFVKHVQCWSHSPYFAFVPEEAREFARTTVPWSTEPLVYRAGLDERLPAGLSLPRCHAVDLLPDEAAVLWLESLDVLPAAWTVPEAARLLGRLAGSRRVAELAGISERPVSVHSYVHGRLAQQVFPMLREPATWAQPGMELFEPVRERLLAIVDRAPALADELAALPQLTGHGDACPANLLTVAGRDGVVLIDLNYFGRLPVAFDLGQLLVGDVQLGASPCDSLVADGAAALEAYGEGLADEGAPQDPDVVRRAHALQMVLFSAVTMPPVEAATLGEAALGPVDHRLAVATYGLDLLDATE